MYATSSSPAFDAGATLCRITQHIRVRVEGLLLVAAVTLLPLSVSCEHWTMLFLIAIVM